MEEIENENSTSSTVVLDDVPQVYRNTPHPLLELPLEKDFGKLEQSKDKFHVELSNLSLVKTRGGSTMLRFNLSWYFHDPVHGWLGDCSMGCLAYRDRFGDVGWANHKLSFGGAFSKSVHSPTKGYYNLVLGIIKASKFQELLVMGPPKMPRPEPEKRRRVTRFLKEQEGVLGDGETGQTEESDPPGGDGEGTTLRSAA